MYTYNKLNKSIALSMFMLLGINTYPMIVGFSTLNRHFNHQSTPHKIILMYDHHALYSKALTKEGHVQDMHKLIEALTECSHNVPFLIELSEHHKNNTTLQEGLPLSPSNVPIQLALDHNMTHKNISFVPFDIRKHSDYWMRDMLLQTREFAQAVNQKHKFPTHFYDVTSTNFLQHLKNRHKLTIELIQQLPAAIRQQHLSKSEQLYTNCNTEINNLLRTHHSNHQEHLFNLIYKLTEPENNKLYFTIVLTR